VRTSVFFLLASLLASLLSPIGLFASDGVIEINQAQALAGGVTPGDAPGFPVTLSASGSYILTGDLLLSAADSPENSHGIVITAEAVVLNLNGFSINGPTRCNAPHPLTCGPLGTGNGIEVPGSSRLTVRNGIILGVGNKGIHQENGTATYEDLHIAHCGGDCMQVQNAMIDGVQVQWSGDRGISLFEGALTDSIVNLSKNSGIVATFARIEGNSSSNNGDVGISTNFCSLTGNQILVNVGTALVANNSSWGGNSLRQCSGTCQDGMGNLQTGINDCDGVACP